MKYKVEDRVRIKSLDWYNQNKDELGDIDYGKMPFMDYMSEFCNRIVTISNVNYEDECYEIEEDGAANSWTDEMIECKVEEETKNNNDMEEKETLLGWIKESDNLRLVPHKDYEIKYDGDNFYLVKKKKKYPKTYEECCRVLGLNSEITDSELVFYYPLKCGDYTTVRLPEMEKFEKFIQLYLCRNAYWKIAGEEMGLGKPWKPDYTEESWEQGSPIKYVIYYTGTHITKEPKCTPSYILCFPSAEMRDAFYENFKEEIEICKKLL